MWQPDSDWWKKSLWGVGGFVLLYASTQAVDGFFSGAGIDLKAPFERVGKLVRREQPATNDVRTGTPGTLPKSVLKTRPPPPKRNPERTKCERDRTDAHERWIAATAESANCTSAAARNFWTFLMPNFHCRIQIETERTARELRIAAYDKSCPE